jgi:cytidine deaminase
MNKLIKKAETARKKAYVPYSHFRVGAALETKDGKIFTGCNIENASFGITICAERVALFKAIAEGAKKFKRIAIVADTREPCPPCGICRQALFEFAPDIEIVMANVKGKSQALRLTSLLPNGFKLKR